MVDSPSQAPPSGGAPSGRDKKLNAGGTQNKTLCIVIDQELIPNASTIPQKVIATTKTRPRTPGGYIINDEEPVDELQDGLKLKEGAKSSKQLIQEGL